MGEILNKLVKLSAVLLALFFATGGIYAGTASLSVDVAIWHNVDLARMAKAEGYSSAAMRLAQEAKYAVNHHALEAWRVAIHPVKFGIPSWKPLFTPPANIVGNHSMIGRLWNSQLGHEALALQNLFHHLVEPIVVGLILALLTWEILHPLARSGVAKSLATTNKKIFGKPRDLPRGDGFVLARDVRLDRKGSGNPHVLTIGPSGGSKTASQVIPSVLQLPKDCGAVITDPKGEILARCGDRLRRQGHEVIVLGPLAGFGHGLDPLKLCKSADDCRDTAQQILQAGSNLKGGGSSQDEKWNNMTRACLSAYLTQAWSEGLGLADALQAAYADDFSGEAITHSAALLNYRMYEGLTKSGSTDGSVLGTLQSVIQEWTSAKVVGWMNSERQFKFESLRKGAVVFLVSSASDARKSKPIQRFLFSRLFDYLAESHGANVRIWIDEFANLQLEGIDEALNLLRSAGVGIHAFVQNLSQVFYVNGRDGGAVIAESFGTVCVFAGLRNDAADLAKLIGEDEDVKPNYSTQDEKMRAGFTPQKRQAIDGAMLRQIGAKQVLIICGNRKPVLAKLKPWYSRLGRLRRLVLPKIFRKDWDKIPPEARDAFFNGLPKIEPIEIVLPPKKEKKGQGDQGEKPKRKKTVRIDLDDLGAALAPHLQPQMPAPEDDGYMDALAKAADPFAGLDVAPDDKAPHTDP